MDPISRRSFFTATAGGLAAGFGGALRAAPQASSPMVAVIHVTDLFRPYADGDDHWDLACDFALASAPSAFS